MLLMFSCSENTKKNTSKDENITILIQPFSDISSEQVNAVASNIKKIYPKIKVLEPIDLPKSTFYQPRNRYRADSLIYYLNKRTSENFVTIGLTSKDISTTKGKVDDFGVMGLGFCPGKACVASNFRLNTKNSKEQLLKVAIHELGHTQGLPHCIEKTCFMRDAKGKNPTDEEKDFCKKCKTFLQSKNWSFY